MEFPPVITTLYESSKIFLCKGSMLDWSLMLLIKGHMEFTLVINNLCQALNFKVNTWHSKFIMNLRSLGIHTFRTILYLAFLFIYKQMRLKIRIMHLGSHGHKNNLTYLFLIWTIDYIDKQAGRNFCLASLTRKRRIFIQIWGLRLVVKKKSIIVQKP